MNQFDLIVNQELRNNMIARVEVLEQVKEILTLGTTEFVTVELAAQYYEVDRKTLEKTIERNRQELESDGLALYKHKEVKEMIVSVENTQNALPVGFKIPPRGLRLIPIRAMLRIGMRLTESDIAKKVREKLLEVNPQLYYELMPEEMLRIKKDEEEIGNYLEFSFGKDNIRKQVKCGKYYLDFVLYNKYHIEVDEYGHRGYNEEKEIERENYICQNTDYVTIRYNPHTEMPYMLMLKILKYMEDMR